MEFIQTKAIVLNKIQIKDFQYLLKLYTEQKGLITAAVEINHFIQPAHLQVPNIIDVQIVQKKSQRYQIKDIKPSYIYQTLYVDFKKNAIAQFLVEVLIKTLKEEEVINEKIFSLLNSTFIQLDQSNTESLPLFHLLFLREFVILSGHTPLENFDSLNAYFHLQEGKFISHPNEQTLDKNDSQLLYQFFFDNKQLNWKELPVFRLTHILLDYMRHHLLLQQVQSLSFLKDVLMDFELKY